MAKNDNESTCSTEEWRKHHIWCNFFTSVKAEDCEMCKGLNKRYPMNGRNEIEMMKEFFPNVWKKNKHRFEEEN